MVVAEITDRPVAVGVPPNVETVLVEGIVPFGGDGVTNTSIDTGSIQIVFSLERDSGRGISQSPVVKPPCMVQAIF